MLSGPGYGRIRNLVDDRRQPLKEAGPSVPVIVSGRLDTSPSAGDRFYVLEDIERARSIAEERKGLARQDLLAVRTRVTASNLFAEIAAGQVQTINLIIKGGRAAGSVETLTKTVTDANTDEVKVRVIHSGVGAINESDVELAMATRTKPTDNKVAIIGFHVVAEDAARALAEQNHIDIKLYRVIYEIFDDLKKALSGNAHARRARKAPRARGDSPGHQGQQDRKRRRLLRHGRAYPTRQQRFAPVSAAAWW